MSLNIEITDKKVLVNDIELLRLQRRYWVDGKRDIITYRRKWWDICTKKLVWRNWGKIDTLNLDAWHDGTKWIFSREKSQEEINNEIMNVAKLLMRIITHPTRGDLGGCYPELEELEIPE